MSEGGAAYGGIEAARRIASASGEDRWRALDELRAERTAVVDTLIDVVRREGERQPELVESGSGLHVALLALGLLRAAVAVPVIVPLLTVRGPATAGESEKVGLDAQFPALRALIEIGEPSVRQLSEAAAMAMDDLTIQLAVVGLIAIEGREVARLRLERLRRDVIAEFLPGDERNVETALTLVDMPTVATALGDSAGPRMKGS